MDKNKDILLKMEKVNKHKLKKISKILNIDKFEYQIELKDSDENLVYIYLNDKLILIGEYCLLGIYQKKLNLWLWASQSHGINQKTIKRIQKIKMFNHLFEYNTSVKSKFYYQLLTQDIIKIYSDKELSWINNLLLYLSNHLYFLNIEVNDNLQFVTLRKIKELCV